MKILYVHGNYVTREIAEAMYRIGHDVEIYPKPEDSAVLKDEIVEEVADYVREKQITHIVSVHLIYNLAMAAYKTGIKYLVIVWDAPYYKLYSPFGRMDNCYFSVFDKVDYQRFVRDGIPHVYYQPLAIDRRSAQRSSVRKRNFLHDISFIGSLYDENFYDEYVRTMPEIFREFFDSIFEEAAFRWDGIDRICGKTGREVLEYLKTKCPGFELYNVWDVEDIKYFEAYYLARKLANIERISILNLLAQEYEVALYTTSQKDIRKLSGIQVYPSVHAREEAPAIFNSSRINLNITLHSIEGGTPQRVLDIMEAGGFVLSTYCPETTELFEEDKEIVMFKSPEELIEKVGFYLSHEEERQRIAAAGHEKVLRCYTHDIKMKKFINWVEEGDEKRGDSESA